jgi:beta-RFAP synthase
VIAPCRLHFGLLGFRSSAFPFGGAGVMLDLPAAIVALQPADTLRITGAAVSRARRTAAAWSRFMGRALRDQHLHIEHLVDQHVGLGSGTQLAMAIGKALFCWVGEADTPVERLAASVGRGERSSVGSLGFFEGGFIFERGHVDGDASQGVAADYQRWPIPSDWRFVVCRPTRNSQGLSGMIEQAAFARLPPVPAAVTDRLRLIGEAAMIPALRAADVAAFGDSVYEYGRLAGACFAKVQGGPFASSEIATIVEAIREFGVRGAGQSSWGPAVFAIVEDPARANELGHQLDARFGAGNLKIDVAAASASGAKITKLPWFSG